MCDAKSRKNVISYMNLKDALMMEPVNNHTVITVINGYHGNISDIYGSVSVDNTFVEFKWITDKFVIPSISTIGIVGNVLTIAILTRTQFHKHISKLEKSVHLGLIALALSDFVVCLLNLSNVFIPDVQRSYKVMPIYSSRCMWLYRELYQEGIVNTFVMISSWFIVWMAFSRYVVICHPVRGKYFLSATFTKLMIILLITLSIVFNLPKYWKHEVKTIEGKALYYIDLSQFARSWVFMVYRIVYTVLGTFVPIAILIFCNFALIRTLHRSFVLHQRYNVHIPYDDEKRHRITLTLVLIIAMYLITVAPSSVLNFIQDIELFSLHYRQPQEFHKFASDLNVVLTVFNMLEAINFSFNFLLYCGVNMYFRHEFVLLFAIFNHHHCQTQEQTSQRLQTTPFHMESLL